MLINVKLFWNKAKHNTWSYCKIYFGCLYCYITCILCYIILYNICYVYIYYNCHFLKFWIDYGRMKLHNWGIYRFSYSETLHSTVVLSSRILVRMNMKYSFRLFVLLFCRANNCTQSIILHKATSSLGS